MLYLGNKNIAACPSVTNYGPFIPVYAPVYLACKHNRCTKIKISVYAANYCTLQEGRIFLAVIKPEISLPYS
jgi:hypothetical protein